MAAQAPLQVEAPQQAGAESGPGSHSQVGQAQALDTMLAGKGLKLVMLGYRT